MFTECVNITSLLNRAHCLERVELGRMVVIVPCTSIEGKIREKMGI